MADPRICIVGAGGLSTKRIYPNIGAAGGVLVGTCDLDAEKAERNARRFGGKAYSAMEAMLKAEKPDAVMICIGPSAHAKLGAQVLNLGYPIYTEKPPAPDSASALALARLAQDKKLLCTTAFKKRYTKAANRAKEWLAALPEGERLAISVDYSSGAYGNTHERDQFLFDFAIHVIDLVPYLFGEVAEVFAFSKGPQAYAVSLRFKNGAVGSLSLNDGRSFGVPTEEIEMTVRGGHFMTIHNSSSWRITAGEKPVEWREPPTFVSGGDSGHDTGHLAEIEDFFAALREKRGTRSEIHEGYKSLVLYEAIRDSAASGRVVKPVFEKL